jgi:flavin reductase (DIM6/NTAB) family NADH-FMN oxidoreductase RutF
LAVSADEFKAGLSLWGSGVTIVTSRAGDEIHGMTVSAFSSVSLDPPLVLVCADKSSNTLAVIEKGRCFAANVLASHQQDLSNRFASKKDEFRRFEGVETADGATGAPLIAGCLANIDCRVVAAHDAGDHVIYVGEVVEIREDSGDPLIHFQGRYRALAANGG